MKNIYYFTICMFIKLNLMASNNTSLDNIFEAIHNEDKQSLCILMHPHYTHAVNPNNLRNDITPLMSAVNCDNVEAVRCLIYNGGANPNIKNSFGWTALDCAFFSSEKESMVRILIASGANPNLMKNVKNKKELISYIKELKNRALLAKK